MNYLNLPSENLVNGLIVCNSEAGPTQNIYHYSEFLSGARAQASLSQRRVFAPSDPFSFHLTPAFSFSPICSLLSQPPASDLSQPPARAAACWNGAVSPPLPPISGTLSTSHRCISLQGQATPLPPSLCHLPAISSGINEAMRQCRRGAPPVPATSHAPPTCNGAAEERLQPLTPRSRSDEV